MTINSSIFRETIFGRKILKFLPLLLQRLALTAPNATTGSNKNLRIIFQSSDKLSFHFNNYRAGFCKSNVPQYPISNLKNYSTQGGTRTHVLLNVSVLITRPLVSLSDANWNFIILIYLYILI